MAAPVAAPAGKADFAAQLEGIYAAHFAPLVSWLHHAFGAGPPEPEDVAQRAFANLAQRGDLSDVANLKAFLWRTARNIAISEKRREARGDAAAMDMETIFFQPDGEVLNPERVLESKDVLAAMIAAVEAMPEQRRRVFVLHRIDGLNYTEVGRRLGISRTAVTKHLVRAGLDISRAYRTHAAAKRGEDA